MGEKKSLDVSKTLQLCLKVMLEKDDNERKRFVHENKLLISALIKLLKQMTHSDDDDGKSLMALRCLGKLSEIPLDDECYKSLFDDDDDEFKQSPFWSEVSNFFVHWDQSTVEREEIMLKLTIIVNVLREKSSGEKLVALLANNEEGKTVKFTSIPEIFDALNGFNESDRQFNLLTSLVVNLSALDSIFENLLAQKPHLMKAITDILRHFEESRIPEVRVKLLSVLTNLLIRKEGFNHIVTEQQGVIVKLLYPLAGPTGDQYDDEDMAKLPIDLQYLGEEKQPEPDEATRIALINCLLLMSRTREGRKTLKAKGAYLILRELHKWEQVRRVQKRMEDVIDILIKEEYEYDSFPDLFETEVPEHLLEKFDRIDNDLLDL